MGILKPLRKARDGIPTEGETFYANTGILGPVNNANYFFKSFAKTVFSTLSDVRNLIITITIKCKKTVVYLQLIL